MEYLKVIKINSEFIFKYKIIISLKDILWLSCKYPRLITVNLDIESNVISESHDYKLDGILHYDSTARLDPKSPRTIVSFQPKHQLKLFPRYSKNINY